MSPFDGEIERKVFLSPLKNKLRPFDDEERRDLLNFLIRESDQESRKFRKRFKGDIMPGYKTIVDDRVKFCTFFKNERKNMRSSNPEQTLKLIDSTFKAISEHATVLTLGDIDVQVRELRGEEIKALCLFAKKFFSTQSNLPISKDLLLSINTINLWNRPFTDFDIGEDLNALKRQIYANEALETNEGGFPNIQKQLLNEIKINEVRIKKLERKLKITNFIHIAGMFAAAGAVLGGFALLLAAGVAFVPVAAALVLWFVVAPLLAIGGTVGAGTAEDRMESQLCEDRKLQEKRIRVFEKMNDVEFCNSLCRELKISPEAATLEDFMKSLR